MFSRPYLVLSTVTLMLYIVASVCLSSVTLCVVAKRCVLEQKLLLTASRIWEIHWHQNEWPWPLFRGHVNIMSTIAYLHYIRRCISQKRLEIQPGFQRTTNGKWHMGIWAIKWSR